MDESKWTKVGDGALFRNKPTELNFFVPETLTGDSYRIVLRTSYLSKDKDRKTIVEAVSDRVSVSSV